MKRAGVVCIVLSLVSLVACGDNEEDEKNSSSEKKPSSTHESKSSSANLAIIEAGFADMSVYAYVENKENREVAFRVNFVAYDANDKKVDDPDVGTYVLAPKSMTFVATSSTHFQEIARVEAESEVGDDDAIPQHAEGSLEATVTGIEKGFPKVVKTRIKNNYPQEVSFFHATLACKDASGKVNYIINSEIEGVEKGATFNEDYNVIGNASSDVESCELFPQIEANTLFFD